ncbi:MAG: flagellar brake protein [Cellvibrionaceae bacterium]
MSLFTSVIKRFTAPKTEISESGAVTVNNAQGLSKASPSLSSGDKEKLTSLLNSRQLLEAQHLQVKTQMQTMILDINMAEGYILLDELFPAPTSISLKEGNTLTLRHHNDGNWLQFSVTILHRSSGNGSPFYVVSLPETIETKPRRRSDRAPIDSAELITAKVTSPIRSPWHAAVSDISAGGVSFVVGGNVLDQLSRDSILPRCQLELAPGFTIDVPVQVKHYRFQRKPLRQTTVSGQFLNLTPQQQQQLQSFVATRLYPDNAAA